MQFIEFEDAIKNFRNEDLRPSEQTFVDIGNHRSLFFRKNDGLEVGIAVSLSAENPPLDLFRLRFHRYSGMKIELVGIIDSSLMTTSNRDTIDAYTYDKNDKFFMAKFFEGDEYWVSSNRKLLEKQGCIKSVEFPDSINVDKTTEKFLSLLKNSETDKLSTIPIRELVFYKKT